MIIQKTGEKFVSTQVGEASVALRFDTKGAASQLKAGTESALASVEKPISTWGITLASTVANIAIQVIGNVLEVALNGLEGGIKRLDTLERFPKVLQSIGFSADDASKTSEALYDYVQGLPTPLNDALTAVQRIASTTGDLDKATTVYKAMNNALLSGGSDISRQSQVMTQWLQAVSRGKFVGQEWNDMMEVMPGVMNAATKDMLGSSAGVEDLRDALSSGKISMGDFLDEIIKLDKEGSGSFESLEKQALVNTQGIETGLTLVSQSWEIMWKDVLDAVGSDNIQNALGGLQDFVKGIGKSLVDLVYWIKGVIMVVETGWNNNIQPVLQSIWDWIEINILPAVQEAMDWISSNVAPIVDNIFSHLQSIFMNIVEAIKILWDNIVTVVDAIMPIVQPVLDILVGAVEDVITMILTAIDIAIAIIDAVLSAAVWTWENIISPIVGFIGGIIKAIVSFFGWMVGQVIAPIDSVRSAFVNAFNNARNWVRDRINDIVNFVSSIPGKVGGKINEIGDKFRDAFENIKKIVSDAIEAIIGFITNIPSRIGDIGGQIGGQISSGVSGAIEGVKGAISGLLSNIPGLATGGYVHATPGGTLAVIGEGGEDEFVIPRSQMIDILTGVANRPLPELKAENMRVDGGGVAIYNTFQINNELDAEDIGRRINNSIRLATS